MATIANPLAGIQSIQQSPSGIQGILAQYLQQQSQQPQQEAQPSELGDYVRQLQDSGQYSPDEIGAIIDQIRQNNSDTMSGGDGGNNTLQGSAGNDALAQQYGPSLQEASAAQAQTPGAGSAIGMNPQQYASSLPDDSMPQASPDVSGSPQGAQSPEVVPQSPLNNALNTMASGKGNINYDQLVGSYPTPRPAVQQSLADLVQMQQEQHAADNSQNGGLSAVAGMMRDTGNAKALQIAQQNAVSQQLNQRDISAYNAAMEVAKNSGVTQNEANKIASDAALKAAEAQKNTAEASFYTDTKGKRWKIDEKAKGPNGEPIMYNEATGEAKVVPVGTVLTTATKGYKPTTAQSKDISSQVAELTGEYSGGKIDKEATPISPAVGNAMRQFVTNQVSSGVSIPDAIDSLSKLTGVKTPDDLVKETRPGMLWGTNPTKYNTIDSKGLAALVAANAGNAQTSPNVGGSAPSISPNVMPNALPTATPAVTGALSPLQLQNVVKTAKEKGASAADIQLLIQKLSPQSNNGQ